MIAAGAKYQWSDIGVHPFAGAGLVVGLLVAVIGRFLATLYHTGDGEQGLAQTSVWFDWIGLTVISVSLIVGALVSRATHPGIRIAVIAIGLYILLQSTAIPIWHVEMPSIFG